METKLARISQLSKENPDMVFTSLGHLINKEMLENCHVQMDGTKAVGIDGITDNTERITAFRYHVMKSLFYCLNRRSQKKSYNWVEFLNMIDNSYPLVRPRIYVSVYN